MVATKNGHEDIVRYLVEKGSDVNYQKEVCVFQMSDLLNSDQCDLCESTSMHIWLTLSHISLVMLVLLCRIKSQPCTLLHLKVTTALSGISVWLKKWGSIFKTR